MPRQPLPLIAALLVLHLAGPRATRAEQPDAPLERPIRALSPEQVADLRAGRGMGLALAAELNGYPGPRHVLEHAEALGLTPDQVRRTTALTQTMTVETAALGQRLIDEERALDQLVATGAATPSSLDAATAMIGATQARLRAAHLRTHLEMAELLTPDQRRHYAMLRGYEPAAPAAPTARHRGHAMPAAPAGDAVEP